MAGEKRTRRIVGLVGLWYLLASAYLLARLLSHRFLVGVWGFDAELAVEALIIPLAQLGVVHLLGLDRSRRQANGEDVSPPNGTDAA
jgi:hypothetical protein